MGDAGIERVPGIHGGAPIIAGKQTPVRAVAALVNIACPNDAERVAAVLPDLRAEQPLVVLRCCSGHAAALDELIARQDAAFQELARSRCATARTAALST